MNKHKNADFLKDKEKFIFFEIDPIIRNNPPIYFDPNNKIKILSNNINTSLVLSQVKFDENSIINFSNFFKKLVIDFSLSSNICVSEYPHLTKKLSVESKIFPIPTKLHELASDILKHYIFDSIDGRDKDFNCIYTIKVNENFTFIEVKSVKLSISECREVYRNRILREAESDFDIEFKLQGNVK